MNHLPALLQLLVVLPLGIGIFFLCLAPEALFGWAEARREEEDRRRLEQAELARKIAIAEEAIAARARGEAFIPPSDYDR